MINLDADVRETGPAMGMEIPVARAQNLIEGARGVLINVTGGTDLGLYEVHEASEIVAGLADPDAHIIFGAVIDENLQDQVRVTVIATGFKQRQEGYQQALQEIGRSAYARGENIDAPAWSRWSKEGAVKE